MAKPQDTPQIESHPPNDSATACAVADALARLHVAEHDLYQAKTIKDLSQIKAAQHRLQRAVEDARDLGVLWGAIGDALGIARGNAYQRYRLGLPRAHR